MPFNITCCNFQEPYAWFGLCESSLCYIRYSSGMTNRLAPLHPSLSSLKNVKYSHYPKVQMPCKIRFPVGPMLPVCVCVLTWSFNPHQSNSNFSKSLPQAMKSGGSDSGWYVKCQHERSMVGWKKKNAVKSGQSCNNQFKTYIF